MMSKRFIMEIATALVAHLHASGIDPEAKIVPPSTSLYGGCSDPGCCTQHPGVTAMGEPMASLETKVSGTQLHRIAVKLGLVKPRE